MSVSSITIICQNKRIIVVVLKSTFQRHRHRFDISRRTYRSLSKHCLFRRELFPRDSGHSPRLRVERPGRRFTALAAAALPLTALIDWSNKGRGRRPEARGRAGQGPVRRGAHCTAAAAAAATARVVAKQKTGERSSSSSSSSTQSKRSQ